MAQLTGAAVEPDIVPGLDPVEVLQRDRQRNVHLTPDERLGVKELDAQDSDLYGGVFGGACAASMADSPSGVPGQ